MVSRQLRIPALPRLLAGGLLTVAGHWALATDPLPVATVEVRAEASRQALELEGSLEPQLQSVLSAQVAGVLRSVTVKAGDRVKAGQVLARIDERELAAGVAGSDAAVAQAQAALVQARQVAGRTRDLRAQGFVAAAAMDAAQSQLDAAQAAVAAAQAARQQATLARGHAEVTAPFDGWVRSTQAEAGDLAMPGKPLLTLFAPDRLRATVQVPLSRADLVRDATDVQVLMPGGSMVTPVRRTAMPSADPTSQTLEWRLDLPAGGHAAWQPGTPVRVRFSGAAAPAGASGVPGIPVAALLRRGELTAVYAVDGGRFVLKAVRVGPVQGDRVPVLAGLKAGERIAADAIQAGLAGARPAAQP